MRIVLIGPEPPWPGGVAAHTAGLGRALTAAGHETTTLSYSRCYPDAMMRWLGRTEEKVLPKNAVIDCLRPASWPRAKARLDRFAPDVVVAQWWHPMAAPALSALLGPEPASPAASGPARVLVCHNALPHEAFPLARRLTRTVFARADAMLVHSRAVANRVEELGAPLVVPIEIRPMPLLVETTGRAADREWARRALGVEAGHRLALFVGHGRSYKGLDILLEAWRRARMPADTRLLVAGEVLAGPIARARLLRRARACSADLRDGYLADEELVGSVAAADLLVLPYRRASQSGLVPVARALGVRVLASDAGGLAEQFPDDLAGATLVRPGDTRALAGQLRRLLGRESLERPAPQGMTDGGWPALVEALELLERRIRKARGAC